MGAQASQERPDVSLSKKLLEERPEQPDASFWTSIWALAPPRSANFLPDPKILSEITTKSPKDFATLLLLCVHHVKLLKDADSSQLIPDVLLDQLSWGLNLFTSACEILISNPNFFALLERVDADLARQVMESKPEMREAAEIAKKKLDETNKRREATPKNVEPKGEEPPSHQVKKSKPKPKPTAETGTQPKKVVPKLQEETSVKPKFSKKQNGPQGEPTVSKAAPAQNTRPKSPKQRPEASQAPQKVPQEQQRPKSPKQRPETSQAPQKVPQEQQRPKSPKQRPEASQAPQKVPQEQQRPKSSQVPQQQKPAAEVTKQKPKARKEKPAAAAKPTQEQPVAPKEQNERVPSKQKPETRTKSPQAQTRPVPKSPLKPQQESKPKKPQAKNQSETPKQNPEAPQKEPVKKTKKAQTNETSGHSKEAQPEPPAETQDRPHTAPKKPRRKQTPTPVEAGATTKQSQEEPPKKTQEVHPPRSKTPSETEAELFHAMKVNNGKCVHVFAETLSQALMKVGLTLEGKETYWTENTSESASMNRTRRDLVHGLLGVLSLGYFVQTDSGRLQMAISLPDFPAQLFLQSTCGIATQYLQQLSTGVHDQVTFDLLRNCFALATRLFGDQSFRAAFKDVKPSVFLKAFALSPKAVPLFEPFSPLSSEALSFLYMALLSQPALAVQISKGKYSNTFIYNLAYTAQLVYERAGFCYIHSIVLSIILLLVTKPTACQNLSDEYTETFNCKYKLDKGSYADLVMNVLLNICDKENFWPSLVCIFHMLAPHVRTFSSRTAQRVMALFDLAMEKQKPLVPLFIEAFASIVQKRDNSNNHFLVCLIQRGSALRKMSADCPRIERSLPVLQKYITSAIKAAKATGKGKVSGEDFLKILEAIDVDQVFNGQTVTFVKHPHVFGGEMEKTWPEWADLLFARCFSAEIELTTHA